MITIHVIMGSTRQGRFVEQPAKWIFEKLSKTNGVKAELIDLRDWDLPFFDEPVGPSMFTLMNKDYVSPLGKKWAKKVSEADGYIMVSPEYNHGYSAVLKNAIDWVYNEWNNKPVAFVSYGGISGGTRAVQQLRQVAIEMQLVPIRNGVHIPFYWEKLDNDGKLDMSAHENGAQNLISQLVTYAKSLQTMRK